MKSLVDQQEHKDASEEASKSGEKFDQAQFEAIREKARFFDRLGLLSGGAIVLSVTFLGYVSSRPSVKILWPFVLYISWGSLLVALLASMYRNWHHEDYLYYTRFAGWAEHLAKLKQAEIKVVQATGAVVVDPEGQRIAASKVIEELTSKCKGWATLEGTASTKARLSEKVSKVLDYAAHIGLFVGIVLLVAFAVLNSP